ncbi:MAG: UDP-N-acetyl-D-glucosamine 2-epimerase, UDP-hydrolysing [Gammaproteobacteria bacterium RIFCSPHIGHO2_12_FULL_36_30]|nr:MAG: UDP-N-acetyl-D-glucosamine 2-epimerase, UDP-hydrolysing [Gammaproteobacteria bacterium RIFCSPHIGHO2_12_FULL_36_30]
MSTKKQSRRKIAVVTGTRAEYGLLKNLLNEIKLDVDLQLQLIVTGMHLSSEFGLTYLEIENDCFEIDAKIEMLLSSDTAIGVAKSIGIGILGFADAFERLKPDVIVVLGDRFEILAAVQTAMILKIPVAHIHGGELTQGAIDDGIRHAITKMSHLHFAATEVYRHRIIQLGESPDRVFNYGALGVERIKKTNLLTKKKLEVMLNFQFSTPTFLVTYHPATLSLDKIKDELRYLFSALDAFLQAKIIFTKSNADEAGRLINQQIDLYCEKNINRAKAFTSMGDLNYLSTMQYCDVIIGNSSSGIIEAPTLHKPTVNIGNRQEGRLFADSIIQCGIFMDEIEMAIKKALSPEFKNIVKKTISPYDSGNTAEKIKKSIKNVELKKITQKKFYDMAGHEYDIPKNNYHCRSWRQS